MEANQNAVTNSGVDDVFERVCCVYLAFRGGEGQATGLQLQPSALLMTLSVLVHSIYHFCK